MPPAFFNPRRRSLLRGALLALLSLAWAFHLADFPRNRATLLLVLPTLGAIAGTVDTIRCMQRRWSLFHAGVILCIYMELMAIAMILFMLCYPYALWLSETH